jgi:protease I
MKRYIYLLLMIPFLLNSCQGGEDKKMEKNEEKTLAGKSILMVIAPNNFRDEEFKEPHSLFIEEGATVTVASTDTAEAEGMLGMKVKPDKLLEEIEPLDFDAIVLVGGSGSPVLWDNEILHSYIKKLHENDKIVAAICLSPVAVVNTGLLDNKKATCFKTPEVQQIFDKHNVTLTGEKVEVTDNIITANGPPAAREYGETIVKLLK